jgi:hypothetical protein
MNSTPLYKLFMNISIIYMNYLSFSDGKIPDYQKDKTSTILYRIREDLTSSWFIWKEKKSHEL